MTTQTVTKFGSHFIMDWRNCKMLWFWRHLAPTLVAEGLEFRGVVPQLTASPLLVGSATHSGLEAYYLSGWKDGQYKLEAALVAARAHFVERKSEFASTEVYNEDLSMVEKLLDGYDGYYGPTGANTDWPEFRVVPDGDGLPLVEREYEIGLGFQDFAFTARIDLVVEARSYLGVLEHKTTSARGLPRLIKDAPTNLQLTGQHFCLRCAHPEMAFNAVWINALVKDRGSKSKLAPFERQPFSRSDAHLDKFKLDVIRSLTEIEQHVGEYRTLAEAGMDPFEAARQVFVQNTTQCYVFRACDYHHPCWAPGKEQSLLGEFRVNERSSPLLDLRQ